MKYAPEKLNIVKALVRKQNINEWLFLLSSNQKFYIYIAIYIYCFDEVYSIFKSNFM